MENYFLLVGMFSLFILAMIASAGSVYVFCPSMREDIKADFKRKIEF